MSSVTLPEPAFMQDEEMRMFADAATRYFSRAAPSKRIEKWIEQGQVDREFWREAGEAGFLGVSMPEAYGGPGGDFRHSLIVSIVCNRLGLEGFSVGLHNIIIAPYIALHGTDEQKRRFIPRIVSGDSVCAIAMSEPGIGSDLQAIRTTAIRDGNGYRLNGSKTFISNGQVGDLIVVVAKTDPSQGARGISLFVLEADNLEGFRRGRKLDKIGLDAQDTSELFFEDVFVPAKNFLGGEEGKGFFQLMAELPRERLSIATTAVTNMEKALNWTIDYTRDRKAFGQPVLDFQNSQFVLADCKTKAVAAALFVNECIQRSLDGTLDNETSAMCKLFVTETEWEIVDACLQLHGGYGYINEYPIARQFRNSRVQRVYGGTSEIMKVIIGRGL